MVAPPFVSLQRGRRRARPDRRSTSYAQNVHWEDEGAFTGEGLGRRRSQAGVAGAIVGHSERRQYFGETDETTARWARRRSTPGSASSPCVGETLEERKRGQTEAVLRRQVEAIAAAVPGAALALDVAYEPVWAIGREDGDARDGAGGARAYRGRYPVGRILYGGSVKPENAEELLSQPDVDGALVGGASLDVESFPAICRTAARLSRS